MKRVWFTFWFSERKFPFQKIYSWCNKNFSKQHQQKHQGCALAGSTSTDFTSLKEVQSNSLDAGSSSKLWLPFMYLVLSFPLPAPRSKLFSNKKCPVITKLTLNKNISWSIILGNKEKALNSHNKNIFSYQKEQSSKCKWVQCLVFSWLPSHFLQLSGTDVTDQASKWN